MVTVIVTDFLALVFLYTQHKTKAKEINFPISVAREGHAFILSYTLKNDIPEIKGFSERNLKRMIRFYREYPFLSEFVPQAVAQLEAATVNTKVPQAVALLSPEDREQMRHLVVRLPWGHNILLIEKIVSSPNQRVKRMRASIYLNLVLLPALIPKDCLSSN